MQTLLRHMLIALLTIVPLASVPAQANELKSPEIWTDMHGHALKGYDAVAYHLERRPVKGDPAYAVKWKKATWLFANAKNRDAFLANPTKWAPQYGGYCAWGIAEDRTVGINPKIFRIFEGKLYLNLNMKVHREWLEKRHAFISRANEKWPNILVMKR